MDQSKIEINKKLYSKKELELLEAFNKYFNLNSKQKIIIYNNQIDFVIYLFIIQNILFILYLNILLI